MDELRREAEKGLALAERAERQGRILRISGIGILGTAIAGAVIVIATGLADGHLAVTLGVAAVLAFLGFQLANAGSASLAAAARARDVAERALAAGKIEGAGDDDDRESEDPPSPE